MCTNQLNEVKLETTLTFTLTGSGSHLISGYQQHLRSFHCVQVEQSQYTSLHKNHHPS